MGGLAEEALKTGVCPPTYTHEVVVTEETHVARCCSKPLNQVDKARGFEGRTEERGENGRWP